MFEKVSKWRANNQARREFQDKMKQENRLPPGQRSTFKFPVIHIGTVPDFDPDSWKFSVWGAVENPIQLSWSEFQALPRQKLKIDLHCVTQWSKFDTHWEGVSMSGLIESGLISPKAEATHVIQIAEKGYKTNLPLSIALQDNFLLATHYDGKPLEPQHGYPLRGVMGHIVGRDDLEDVYLWKGAKWLRGLKFTTKDEPGTWEISGYHNEGDVWREERWGRRWNK